MNNSSLLRLATGNTIHSHRPYVNSAVRFHEVYTMEDRLAAAVKAGWNVFQFPSKMTIGDLLSDSGTTTPTIEQIAASLLGDEAYGTNWGYEQLLVGFEKTFGVSLLGSDAKWESFLFHQCRAAEHALFTQIHRGNTDGEKLTIPNNGHFDTTRANIEMNDISAIDLPADGRVSLLDNNWHFKGNMDIAKLRKLLTLGKYVPLVYCTITNNTNAGQPVSIANLREIRKACDEQKRPFFLDACRFAENAWFIKQWEPGYSDKPIIEIVHEIFALCDGFTISLKKDGLANMGGALCIKKDSTLFAEYPDILDNIRDHQICTEAHPTYGGISGRDIMIIVEGLKTVVTDEYLRGRIGQVKRFGDCLKSYGIPVIEPFGGHAIYIDVDKFYDGTNMRREDFGGITLTALLLLSGPRLCELGAFAFGSYDKATGIETLPPFNFVRAAVPRLKYEDEDLAFVANCVHNLYRQRDILPAAVPVYGREKTLRHFKAKFELRDRV